jgi:hypothetical protein
MPARLEVSEVLSRIVEVSARSDRGTAGTDEAREKLVNALVERQIQAYGVPLLQPWSGRVPIDPDLFALHALTVYLDGRIGTLGREDTMYEYVAFEPDDVQRLWPTRSPEQRWIEEWLVAEASDCLRLHGRRAKQPELLQRCRKELRCSSRAALRAYRRLPPELRYSRGSPGHQLA